MWERWVRDGRYGYSTCPKQGDLVLGKEMMELRTVHVSFQAIRKPGSQLDSINRSSTGLEKREDERRSCRKASAKPHKILQRLWRLR